MIARSVVITGLGAASGGDLGAAAVARRCGLAGPERPGPVPPPRDTRHLDQSARLFCGAAEEAWLDAGLHQVPPESGRAGVLEGSSLGPLTEVIRRIPERRRPSDLIRFMTGAGGATFACRHQLRGPAYHLSAGSVSSAFAIIEAIRVIARGDADVMVAGGGECATDPKIQAVFQAAGLVDPAGLDQPCRPFDRRRAYTRVI